MAQHEEGLLTNDGWQVRIDKDWNRDGIELHLYRYGFAGERVVREYVTIGANGEMALHAMSEGRFPEERPTWRPTRGMLRALAAALIEEGLIPTTPREERLVGEIEATKRHLDDMRRVALQGVPPTKEAA